MSDTFIITQVQSEECQSLNSNGNHTPVVNEKDLRASKKRRQRSVQLSKRSKLTGSITSTSEKIIQTLRVGNAAAVQPQPNLNQCTLTQGYEQNVKEEEMESKTSSTDSFYLLPAICSQDVNKKCVVIDLDETLVHRSFKPVKNADFIVPVDIEGKVHQMYVLKRPYVDEFLKRMGEMFECVLFTASFARYADPVADLLDKTCCFKSRLYRESCVVYKEKYVKDLSKLGRDLHNVIIIDNSPASYRFPPENAIPVTSWFDDQDDTELLDLIPLLESINNVDDCVTALQTNFERYKASQKFQYYNDNQEEHR